MDKKARPYYILPVKHTFYVKRCRWLEGKRIGETYYYANSKHKKTGVVSLISDKTDTKIK